MSKNQLQSISFSTQWLFPSEIRNYIVNLNKIYPFPPYAICSENPCVMNPRISKGFAKNWIHVTVLLHIPFILIIGYYENRIWYALFNFDVRVRLQKLRQRQLGIHTAKAKTVTGKFIRDRHIHVDMERLVTIFINHLIFFILWL